MPINQNKLTIFHHNGGTKYNSDDFALTDILFFTLIFVCRAIYRNKRNVLFSWLFMIWDVIVSSN